MKCVHFLALALYGSSALTACGGGGSSSAPATHLSVSAAATATAGTPLSVTVAALDAANNVVTGYAGTVRFTSTDDQAQLPANATLTNGTGVFAATLRTAGSQTITATDTVTASIAGTSSAIAVSAGPATHLTVAAPATAQSGTAFDLTVTALDASNNVATTYGGTVRFTSSDGQATLPGSAALTAGAGTFPAILWTAGSQSISATDTETASITGTSSPVAVSAGPATRFSISAPGSAQPGTAFKLTVTALDVANNVATGYTGIAQFSSTDTAAILPPNSTLTNGVGGFSATLETSGSQTITATDTATSITGTSSAIDVTTTPPPIYFSLSVPSTAESGTAFNFTVTALTSTNQVASNYGGTVHFSSTDAEAALPGNATLTNGTGTFAATLLTAGTQTITATDTVTSSTTGTSSSIDVIAGPATHFSVAAPVSARAGTAFTFLVTARDAASNLAGSYAGTVHFSSTDPQASLPADSTLTDGMGIFSATLRTTGTQSLTATDTVTASITGASNSIEIYVNCQAKGEICSELAVCCPGLRCEPVNVFRDVHYCEY
jgi:hypothetical protein